MYNTSTSPGGQPKWPEDHPLWSHPACSVTPGVKNGGTSLFWNPIPLGGSIPARSPPRVVRFLPTLFGDIAAAAYAKGWATCGSGVMAIDGGDWFQNEFNAEHCNMINIDKPVHLGFIGILPFETTPYEKPCQRTSLRSLVSPSYWDRLRRRRSFTLAGFASNGAIDIQYDSKDLIHPYTSAVMFAFQASSAQNGRKTAEECNVSQLEDWTLGDLGVGQGSTWSGLKGPWKSTSRTWW